MNERDSTISENENLAEVLKLDGTQNVLHNLIFKG